MILFKGYRGVAKAFVLVVQYVLYSNRNGTSSPRKLPRDIKAYCMSYSIRNFCEVERPCSEMYVQYMHDLINVYKKDGVPGIPGLSKNQLMEVLKFCHSAKVILTF